MRLPLTRAGRYHGAGFDVPIWNSKRERLSSRLACHHRDAVNGRRFAAQEDLWMLGQRLLEEMKRSAEFQRIHQTTIHYCSVATEPVEGMRINRVLSGRDSNAEEG